VVVGELHLVRLTVAPDEADPPLVVDPDTVLALSIPTQAFQAVAGHDAQFLEAMGRVNQLKFPPGAHDDPTIDAADEPALEQSRGAAIAKAPDHTVTYHATIVTPSVIMAARMEALSI
jgi:hypothetical protein